jgi:KDO2-lipid IV(A) lauroyltransferase
VKKIRDKLIFFIVYIFYIVFSRTPWKVNIFIGSFLGKLFFCFDFKYKYIAFKNLKLIFPEYNYKKIINVAKDCYSNLGKNLFEFFLFPRIKYFLGKIVDFSQKDFEILKSYLNQKKGVVIFSAHFGNWELLGATLALNNLPLAVVVRSVYIKRLNFLVEKLRSSVGELVIGRAKEESLKKLLFVLKKGYIIGVLIDQNIKNVKNVNIKFLGKEASTPISFVEMVIKYNIPSVIGLIYRLKNNKHKVVIFPIKEKFYKDKMEFSKFVNDKISEYINKYPKQWVWMHDRWNISQSRNLRD